MRCTVEVFTGTGCKPLAIGAPSGTGATRGGSDENPCPAGLVSRHDRHGPGEMIVCRHRRLERARRMRGGRRDIGQAEPAGVGGDGGLALVGTEGMALRIPARTGLLAGRAFQRDGDAVGRAAPGSPHARRRIPPGRHRAWRGTRRRPAADRPASVTVPIPLPRKRESSLLHGPVGRRHRAFDRTVASSECHGRTVHRHERAARERVEKTARAASACPRPARPEAARRATAPTRPAAGRPQSCRRRLCRPCASTCPGRSVDRHATGRRTSSHRPRPERHGPSALPATQSPS